MTFSSIFAQFVAFIGGIALQWRKLSGTEPAPAWGEKPAIPEAKPQGAGVAARAHQAEAAHGGAGVSSPVQGGRAGAERPSPG